MFEISKLESVCIVNMAHGKVNALDLEFCRGLTSIFRDLGEDESCSGVILTAQGRVFSAGVDLKRLIREEKSYLEKFLPALIELFAATFRFPKTVGCRDQWTCDCRRLRPCDCMRLPIACASSQNWNSRAASGRPASVRRDRDYAHGGCTGGVSKDGQYWLDLFR